MDIGLYRDEEQFSTFETSSYLENYGDDSSIDDLNNFCKNDLFDCLDGLNSSRNEFFDWTTENERELNGDMAVIPVSGSSCENISNLSTSPPTKDFQKLLGWHNWQSFLNTSVEDLAAVDTSFPPEEDESIIEQTNSCLQEILDLPDFRLEKKPQHEGNVKDNIISTESNIICLSDLESMQHLEPLPNIPVKKLKAGFKKLDLKEQKYIIENGVVVTKPLVEDDCDVDIETVSEGNSSPVLEAGDLNSLLEQFEATEVPKLSPSVMEDDINDLKDTYAEVNIKIEPGQLFDRSLEKNKLLDENNIEIPEYIVDETNDTFNMGINKQNLKAEIPQPILMTERQNSPSKWKILEEHKNDKIGITVGDEKVANPKTKSLKDKVQTQELVTQNTIKISESTTSSHTPDTSTSKKHILDSLPKELIDRIKESGKRRPITVIPPIPNKKRYRTLELETPVNSVKSVNSDTVHLDHNYCGSPSQNYKKDSGFESSEDDDRAIINKQPTVKNADGKLMVSLLKVNTIRNSDLQIQKKKLNLEEYKKRRKGFLTSNSSSQNGSPNTSTCSSPLPEDENLKLLKHQEKLRRMAEEVLNSTPKSERKSHILSQSGICLSPASIVSPLVTPLTPSSVDIPNSPIISVHSSPRIEPPSHLERKILVSFGVNTDFKIAKDEDPLAPVEKLEEIKPLLQKASAKINENSLITSLIENIPKVISKNKKTINKKGTEQESIREHGENKQVLHLEKDRVRSKTVSIGTQTNISLIDQNKRGRVRGRTTSDSSSSSCNSRRSYRRSRKNSDSSSTSSRSSCSSSRSSDYSHRLSYSRSRSRSRSPRNSRSHRSIDRDHINAVEERRIIYVGRILMGTSKEDLRRKFQKFGSISNISLHFRDHGENYGFVTFKYKEDAHEAYEHGNDDPSFPYYKISFGGRREFCKTSYSDLDNVRDDSGYFLTKVTEDSFDSLLREAQEKLRKRKA